MNAQPILTLQRIESSHGRIRWSIDCEHPNGSAATLYVATPTHSAQILEVTHEGVTWNGFACGWPFDDVNLHVDVPRFIGRHLRFDANRRALGRARRGPQPRPFLFDGGRS